jgi:hypothetical protein
MFADPLSLPMSSGTILLPRVNQDAFATEYRFSDALKRVILRIRHTTSLLKGVDGASVKYDRHNVELTVTVFAVGEVPEFQRKAYFVIEHLPSDQSVELIDALADWAIASVNANLVKLLAWES